MDITETLAREFRKSQTHIKNIISLIDEGDTIPFIARYRKEMHGSTDDQTLRDIAERLDYLRGLESRKNEVKALLEGMGKLTEDLSYQIDSCVMLSEVEDIYRPFRPKRRTRATTAREAGLEPLAEYILAQTENGKTLEENAAAYVNADKGVQSPADAIEKARDIIAEDISDNAKARRNLRTYLRGSGYIRCVGAKEEDSVYRNYYDFREPVRKIAGHRILAVNRGEKEGFLKVSLEADRDNAIKLLNMIFVKGDNPLADEVKKAAADSWDRLIEPSLEREIRSSLTDEANHSAITSFGVNLKALLMAPPIKNTVTRGFDPAFRTGCKLAVVDGTGKVLDTAVIYPTPPHSKTEESKAIMKELIDRYNVRLIAIGNGTASRESELFVESVIEDTEVKYMIVSEAGASVYSASRLAKEEFPDFDVSLRSAVSIARRTQDPLAELVKIDPKSIGVGQYQHDMPPKMLDDSLSGVVEDCVNSVGADLNTASASLLSRIAGINSAVAKNIVAYREQKGEFSKREELKQVDKLGEKTFQQCAGFLRIPGGKNILDNTGVHPESYEAAEKLLNLTGYDLESVKEGRLSGFPEAVTAYGDKKAAKECSIGLPTLKDIIKDLMKPGRDPREELGSVLLRSDILSIDDLTEGMVLTGTVRNVVDFGAFVDIGVHQDGLVHVSHITDKFVTNPTDVLSVGDIVQVKVIGVDKEKNRISLSMKGVKQGSDGKTQGEKPRKQPKPSDQTEAASSGEKTAE
ncbi:MAG: RNA-binding transcriptional accessory protein [Oscillospiraceae bacterium]|nr:RNA-binding transcriptional accessory protein [Oscillospiraceae bacterium]